MSPGVGHNAAAERRWWNEALQYKGLHLPLLGEVLFISFPSLCFFDRRLPILMFCPCRSTLPQCLPQAISRLESRIFPSQRVGRVAFIQRKALLHLLPSLSLHAPTIVIHHKICIEPSGQHQLPNLSFAFSAFLSFSTTSCRTQTKASSSGKSYHQP